MTQTAETLDPSVPGGDTGTDLAIKFNAFLASQLSLHSGASRPSYATAGLVWCDTSTSPWVVKIFDGADDIPLYSVNPTSNAVVRVWATAATLAQIIAADPSPHAGIWIDPPGLQSAFADVAAFRARTARRILTSGVMVSALAEVTIPEASPIVLDLNSFINGVVTLTASRQVAVPTNGVHGWSGRVRFVQGGSGGHSLTFASGWRFPGKVAPVASTAAGAEDFLNFEMLGTDSVWGVMNNDVGAPA